MLIDREFARYREFYRRIQLKFGRVFLQLSNQTCGSVAHCDILKTFRELT